MMIQKDYLEYLISESKKISKKHELFDILLYGSSVKGKEDPRDIDLLMLFKDKKLKDRINIAQELKENLKKIKNIDIKTANILDFFDETFLARNSILIEGFSLLNNQSFSEKIGFKGRILFNYTLKNLNHNDKTKFTYALIGRNSPGIIKKLNLEHLGKGVLIAPIENSLIFEDFLKKWNINFNKKTLLISSL